MTKEEREKFKREEAQAEAKARAERERHGGLLAVDDETDTLLEKGSTTPLMSGGKAGLLCVSALFVVAIMLMIKRSLAPPSGPQEARPQRALVRGNGGNTCLCYFQMAIYIRFPDVVNSIPGCRGFGFWQA